MSEYLSNQYVYCLKVPPMDIAVEKMDEARIGKELRETLQYGNELAKGKEGEICAIGDLRATYFNDYELTRKKFIEQPDGRVMFHTGDLGYINENDDLVFVNRKDWMLKINGHRVEPGEIEQSLRKYKGIKQAVVKGFTNPAGQTYLCAYYLSEKEIESIFRFIMHRRR